VKFSAWNVDISGPSLDLLYSSTDDELLRNVNIDYLE